MSEMATDYKRRPITVRDYRLMVERGIIAPDERVELIRGELIAVPPVNLPHRSSVNRLAAYLTRLFWERATVQTQASVVLSEIDEPEPDIALLHYDPSGYASHAPAPADIHLLIEVGDSSRSYDRRVKGPLYSAAGVPEVWLVDVVDDVVTTYREPRGGGYATVRIARAGESIACQAFPHDVVPVDVILRSL